MASRFRMMIFVVEALWECCARASPEVQDAFAAQAQAHTEEAVTSEDAAAEGDDAEEMEEVSEGHACKGKPWRTDLSARMYKCGLQSGGQTAGAASCMSQYVGAACGQCMGLLVHCGMNCIQECCVGKCPASGACVACNKKKCYGSFYACSGEYPR